MDKISVTEEALRSSCAALKQLQSKSINIATECKTQLSSVLNSIDTTFRKDIQGFIEAIDQFQIKLNDCIDTNINALEERARKIPEYEQKTYQKQSIG